MSTPTPAPAPKDSSDSEPAPFDPHHFPRDLRDAQRTAAGLYLELHAYQKTLPWSCKPHPGWPDETERGRARRGRPETSGWTPEQAAEYDRLFEALRKATAAVQAHGWWERCKRNGVKGGDMVDVRQALKAAKGAVPLQQEDVQATA